MAQSEDTELRDLVIDALEKNGSLAKIRALLRANIFLAFEDESENVKQNVNLDNVLKLPEGMLALAVVHEFLEYCNLKNTLFVYMSESRQSKEYNYEGRKVLCEQLKIQKQHLLKEPLLVTCIRNIVKPHPKKEYHSDDKLNNYKDDQNCTYIVHEDSQGSATSTSNSDISSDEKNKLHLRLQLENSDTDTSSSDSARDKSSEYIPNNNIINSETNLLEHPKHLSNQNMGNVVERQEQNSMSYFMHDFKINSSSDSTSYLEVKPINSLATKMFNTTGVPSNDIINEETNNVPNLETSCANTNQVKSLIESSHSSIISDVSPISTIDEIESNKKSTENVIPQATCNSEIEATEYSFDFSSPVSKLKNIEDSKSSQSPTQNTENSPKSVNSSHSSVSISDVADLLSEKSSSFGPQAKNYNSIHNSKSKSDNTKRKSESDDSGDFTESPIPSLSNLSLDIHSE